MVTQANEGSVITDRDFTGGDGELTVEVFSPRVPEPMKFTWSKSLKVGAAADLAVKVFGLNVLRAAAYPAPSTRTANPRLPRTPARANSYLFAVHPK